MIRLLGVHKTYGHGRNAVTALAGVSLDILKGEFVVIMGPSGSGKSTLLHLMGGLDSPTQGEVLVNGRIVRSGGKELATQLEEKGYALAGAAP